MSTATLLPPTLGAGHHPEAPAVRPGGGRPTLEETLLGAWEGLRAEGTAECPVCSGGMTAAADGGICRDCGSHLS